MRTRPALAFGIAPARTARKAYPFFCSLALGASMVAASSAFAHHGRDFLFTQTPDVPRSREIFFLPRMDFVEIRESEPRPVPLAGAGGLGSPMAPQHVESGEEEDAFEFEPALLIGVGELIAVEVHSHFARTGDVSFRYESAALAVNARITPHRAKLQLGVSAEYEMTDEKEEEDPLLSEDEPDRIEARVAVSRSFGPTLIALNLTAERAREEDAETEWGYASGLRGTIQRGVAPGIELRGSLERADHEALLGLYFEPYSSITINLGVGAGLADSDTSFSVRSVFILRLGRVGGA